MTDSVNGVVIDTKKETNGKANSSLATPTNSTSTDNATASVDVEEEKEEIVDDEQTILDKEMMRKAIQMAQSRWVISLVGKMIELIQIWATRHIFLFLYYFMHYASLSTTCMHVFTIKT